MRTRTVRRAAGVALAGYAGVYHLGRTWGTTIAERHRVVPGDDMVSGHVLQTTHAITIDAPPGDVWPWLVQMGWGRGGWYTYRWVDRLLFPANGPSADRLLAQHQRLAVGDRTSTERPRPTASSPSASSNPRGCWSCTPTPISSDGSRTVTMS